MRIILKQDVSNVGQKYDIKDVSDGYARNFLFPNKLAEIATDKAIKNIEILRKAHDAEMKTKRDLLSESVEDLNGITIKVKEKANEHGHLFAGINKDKVAAIVKDCTELDITAGFIQLKEPIKEVGEVEIVVEAGGKRGTFNLEIEKE